MTAAVRVSEVPPADQQWIFEYGINLDYPTLLRNTADVQPLSAIKCVLKGYKLTFNSTGIAPFNPGVETIEKEESSEVHGVLLAFPFQTLPLPPPSSGWVTQTVQVTEYDKSTRYQAIVVLAQAWLVSHNLRAGRDRLALIVQGARQQGLHREWIRFLEAFPTFAPSTLAKAISLLSKLTALPVTLPLYILSIASQGNRLSASVERLHRAWNWLMIGRSQISYQEYDVIILNATIIDGTGAPAFVGEIGIRGDRIRALLPLDPANPTNTLEMYATPSTKLIDATGLVACPGFIDIIGQSIENVLLGDGKMTSKVMQGVTTEITGEGFSPAPTSYPVLLEILRTMMPIKPSLRTVASLGFWALMKWNQMLGLHGFNGMLNTFQRRGISANVGSFLGAATPRMMVLGSQAREATDEELKQMCDIVEAAMEDGAVGVASALIYPPASYASTKELIALARVSAQHGGTYATHLRSEGDGVLQGLEEALYIGREAKTPVEIYHVKLIGKENWPLHDEYVRLIEQARAAGQDLTGDIYPYNAVGTGLSSVLPPWASADGKLFERLADPTVRRQIKKEILASRDPENRGKWETLGMLVGPENVRILQVRRQDNKKYEGKTLKQIADERGVDWVDACIDLLVSEKWRVHTAYFGMSEESIKKFMAKEWVSFGTDWMSENPAKPVGKPHPRGYGTYPRILGKYVREEKVITLEEAIRKMTSAVALRCKIKDRGIVKEHYFADLVVFDPNVIIDKSTWDDPHQFSQGIHHVFVNGVAVVEDGKHTNRKPGVAVRRAAQEE